MLVVAGAQSQHQGFLSQYMSNGMGASKYNGAATYESQRVSSGDIQASTVVISNNSVQDSTESHSPLGFSVTQQFTPAFNGDLPSNFAFQKMWLESFCPSLAFEINGKMWTLKADLPGDLDIHSMANHKFDTYPLIMAAASSAAFAPMPANAFKGEIFGLPINLFVAFA